MSLSSEVCNSARTRATSLPADIHIETESFTEVAPMESLDDIPIVGGAAQGLIPGGHRVVLLPTDDLAGQEPSSGRPRRRHRPTALGVLRHSACWVSDFRSDSSLETALITRAASLWMTQPTGCAAGFN